MPESMRKPATIVASLTLLLIGYVTAVFLKIIPLWLVICLSPFAVVTAIVMLIALGAYTIFLAMLIAGFIAHIKETFLLRYGTETQAIIIKSELYHGPGLHTDDPCFRGQYSFTDQQGRKYSFKFSRECYDPYDLATLGISIDEYYQRGVKRRLIYWGWVPSIHYLYGPDIGAPRLRGRFGLYRME